MSDLDRINPLGMQPDEPLDHLAGLAMFLGGSDDSWTGSFLRLVAKSDPEHKARLRTAFPAHVAAYEAWMRLGGRPTVGGLIDALAVSGIPAA